MGWDRSSPIVIYDKVMRIPCAFVTHNGDSIDEKAPLLRSNDAVDTEARRLLAHMNFEGIKHVHSYLGWEQEFFVITKEAYYARPDLVNCGRTLWQRACQSSAGRPQLLCTSASLGREVA